MAKKKSKGDRLPKNSLLLILVGVIILLGAVGYFNRRSSNDPLLFKNLPTPTAQQNAIDTENDGVYTNYKYKFKLTYPSNIFDIQSKTDPRLGDPDPWDFQSWSRSIDNTKAGSKFVLLEVRVGDLGEKVGIPVEHNFEEGTRLKPGATFSNGDGTKLEIYERGEIKGSVFYFKVPSGVLYGVPAYLYSAEFFKDDKLYVIQLQSNDYSMLLKERKTFDTVVDSFEYID